MMAMIIQFEKINLLNGKNEGSYSNRGHNRNNGTGLLKANFPGKVYLKILRHVFKFSNCKKKKKVALRPYILLDSYLLCCGFKLWTGKMWEGNYFYVS